MKKKIAVLITTDHQKRGVFCGFIDPEDTEKEPLIATDVRMCVRWSPEMRGVLGLAAFGPDKNCRISPPVKRARIDGVTFVCELTDEALRNWEKQPWGT